MTISTLEAYELSDDSQLFIVPFEIVSSNISIPTEQAFIFRLLDSGVEIATTTPYGYFNDGYAQGVASFTVDVDDPNLPAWGTASLSVELMGNPSLSWSDGVPKVTKSGVDVWQADDVIVGARIRVLAQALETAWSVDLIQMVGGTNALTSVGQQYFETVVLNLRSIASTLFTSGTVQPDIPSDNHSTAYADAQDAGLIGNTLFDLTNLASMLGVSRMWATGALFIIFSGVLVFGSATVIGAKSELGVGVTIRPALFLWGGILVAGSLMRFMPFNVAMWVGIIGGLSLVFAFFWRGAP